MDSKTWEGNRCRHHVDFSKWAKKRPAIHPLARPKTRSFCTFRNLTCDRSTTEDKPLYLTSFTGKKSSQSQGKRHCQLLPKDWKTASHALTGDPLAPQQPPVAMGRHYAYAPLHGMHLWQGRVCTLLLLLFAGTIFCEFLRFGKNRKIKYPQKFLPTIRHHGVYTITNCVMFSPLEHALSFFFDCFRVFFPSFPRHHELEKVTMDNIDDRRSLRAFVHWSLGLGARCTMRHVSRKSTRRLHA